jgi:hypothetical protein
MMTCLLKSKIHRATVTGASIDYEGSLTIAADLAERVGLRPYERILVGNLANGEQGGVDCHADQRDGRERWRRRLVRGHDRHRSAKSSNFVRPIRSRKCSV